MGCALSRVATVTKNRPCLSRGKGGSVLRITHKPILQCVELPGVCCTDKNYKDSNLTVYDLIHFRWKCSQIGHKGRNKTL